jgi:hypothetical protein
MDVKMLEVMDKMVRIVVEVEVRAFMEEVEVDLVLMVLVEVEGRVLYRYQMLAFWRKIHEFHLLKEYKHLT